MRETRSYNEMYKVQAVKLAKEIGIKKAATEIGISGNTLSRCVYKAKLGLMEFGMGKAN